MDRDPVYARVIGVFTRYGYRKTAMAELAEAANVSRQTLYNRFGTKAAVLDWAIVGISQESEAHAVAELAARERPLTERVVSFFVEWLGVYASALHSSPHGGEIFEMAKGKQRDALDQSHDRCAVALAEALAAEQMADDALSPDDADDQAFALIMAAKGLLSVSVDQASFEAGIARVVSAWLKPA